MERSGYNIFDSEIERESFINQKIQDLQKKLGRKHFNSTEWNREYQGMAFTYIYDTLGGFDKFKEKHGIPKTRDLKCQVCGEIFPAVRYDARYCGNKCRRLHRYKTVIRPDVEARYTPLHKETATCFICGNTMPKYIRKYSPIKRKFCSTKCRNRHRYYVPTSKNSTKNGV
jgi:hypothetical protein